MSLTADLCEKSLWLLLNWIEKKTTEEESRVNDDQRELNKGPIKSIISKDRDIIFFDVSGKKEKLFD